MRTAAAGAPEVNPGCVGAVTVLTAMAFHFVTSFACAATGTANAKTAPNTANRPNRAAFMACPSLSAHAEVPPSFQLLLPTLLLIAGGVNVGGGLPLAILASSERSTPSG